MDAPRHFTADVINYGQCWEDADATLDGLAIAPGDVCVSVASAGDNVLAMLTRDPARVLAVDVSGAQLACVELRIAAFRTLSHPELLELTGSRPSCRRLELYRRARAALDRRTQEFWDAREAVIARGLGESGRFERRLRFFRRFMLPLAHRRRDVAELLAARTPEARRDFWLRRWNTRRWRGLMSLVFTRRHMQLEHGEWFYHFYRGRPGPRVQARLEHACVALDPSENPYLTWMLTGTHGAALPAALRAENFDVIRARLDRIELRQEAIGTTLAGLPAGAVDCVNLSNVPEYMSPDGCRNLLALCARAVRSDGRIMYWDMLSPRAEPGDVPGLTRDEDLGRELLRRAQTFFYQAVVLERVAGQAKAPKGTPVHAAHRV